MFTVIAIVFLVIFTGFFVYLMQGPVVLDELFEPISVLAIMIYGFTLYFAFISTESSGTHLNSSDKRLFTVIPFFALYAAVFPSGVWDRMRLIISFNGMRRGAVVILAIFLCLSIYLNYHVKA